MRQRIHNTLIVVDRYLRLMGDKTIPDSAEPRLESFYPPFVAGIDLPHQGVVDSYNLYNSNSYAGKRASLYWYCYPFNIINFGRSPYTFIMAEILQTVFVWFRKNLPIHHWGKSHVVGEFIVSYYKGHNTIGVHVKWHGVIQEIHCKNWSGIWRLSFSMCIFVFIDRRVEQAWYRLLA